MYSFFSKNQSTRFYNGIIFRDNLLRQEDLWIAEGMVVRPQKQAAFEVDLQGQIVSPGFIDLQLNGAFGIDFSTQPDRVEEAAKQLPRYGVTAFLPTVISMPRAQYPEIIHSLQARKIKGGAEILGIHLEGPFFNPNRAGAHKTAFLQSFEISSLVDFYGPLSGVELVTLAPELPGALQAIRELRKMDILVAAGHTEANYEEMQRAFDAGLGLITHLFNAMPPLHHRLPGVISAALTDPKIFFSIIADGKHVHPKVLDMAWKANSEGLFLVTDAMEALGLPEGTYRLGEKDVLVKGGAPYLAGTETLAGSVLSMDAAVRKLHTYTGCSLGRALEAASWKPAVALGIQNRKGHLSPGADADFVILSDMLEVQACYVGGECVYNALQN